MGLQCLKMQMNYLGVAAGNRPAKALAGATEEEVVQGGPNDGLNQPPGLLGGKPSQGGGFVGRGKMADQQR